MNHYVAYHSVEVMGRDYEPTTHFSFYTSKSARLVQGAKGGTAWVIVGKRLSGRMQYRLAGAYTPTDVTDEDGTWIITGPGTPLRPPLEVTSLPWFAVLKREQSNFSFGFSRIRDQYVIDALTAALTSGERSMSATATELLDVDVYVEALTSALPAITDTQLAMLRAHYLAPEHVITASELAEACGFADHRVVNSQYGRLGTLLRVKAPELAALEGQRSHAIASFLAPDETHRHWRWQMHEGLVKAFNRLAWFADNLEVGDAKEIRIVAAQEGDLRKRQILHRHREGSLRLAKLQQVRGNDPRGRIVCQVPGCGFDFKAAYGEIGEGYAEVHHIVALAALEQATVTTLDDLAVVCANCHRMIHRGGACRSLAELIHPLAAPTSKPGTSKGGARSARTEGCSK
jgi:predicted HNH restriction endonuclease